MSLNEFERKVIALEAEELVSLEAEEKGFSGIVAGAVLRKIPIEEIGAGRRGKALAFFLMKCLEQIKIRNERETGLKWLGLERRVYSATDKKLHLLRKLFE